ncbi:MAG: hypothetical protein ABFD46_01460 [Armatimonadota bacterium]
MTIIVPWHRMWSNFMCQGAGFRRIWIISSGASGNDTRFFYNNSRNRVKLITKSGSAYYFVYDPTTSIPAVVYEAVGTTAYLNTREPDGSLISRDKYTGGVYQYSRTYHFDGLGSTIALTDENGATTDTYSYDVWGNVCCVG